MHKTVAALVATYHPARIPKQAPPLSPTNKQTSTHKQPTKTNRIKCKIMQNKHYGSIDSLATYSVAIWQRPNPSPLPRKQQQKQPLQTTTTTTTHAITCTPSQRGRLSSDAHVLDLTTQAWSHLVVDGPVPTARRQACLTPVGASTLLLAGGRLQTAAEGGGRCVGACVRCCASWCFVAVAVSVLYLASGGVGSGGSCAFCDCVCGVAWLV